MRSGVLVRRWRYSHESRAWVSRWHLPQLGVPVHVVRNQRATCGERERGKLTTPLEFGTSVTDGQRILTVTGELDMSVSARFEQALLEAVAATRPGGALVVDLSGVQFIDVSSLRAFLRAAHSAQVGHIHFRLATSPVVDRVFDVFAIDSTGIEGSSTCTATGHRSRTMVPPGV